MQQCRIRHIHMLRLIQIMNTAEIIWNCTSHLITCSHVTVVFFVCLFFSGATIYILQLHGLNKKKPQKLYIP